jgi:hypothetical protein
LPLNESFDSGVTKCALRRALRGLVQDRVRDRREKIGYETPEYGFNTPIARARFAEIVLHPGARASGRYDCA